MRPHVDYSNVIYDQNYNNIFHEKMESNAVLAITSALRGSSSEIFIKNKVWNPHKNDDDIGIFGIF